jgi:hypothetical protein
MLVEYDDSSHSARLFIASRLVVSSTYQAAFGKKQGNSLCKLYLSMGGSTQDVAHLSDEKPTEEPRVKKSRTELVKAEAQPVQLMCAMHILERVRFSTSYRSGSFHCRIHRAANDLKG